HRSKRIQDGLHIALNKVAGARERGACTTSLYFCLFLPAQCEQALAHNIENGETSDGGTNLLATHKLTPCKHARATKFHVQRAQCAKLSDRWTLRCLPLQQSRLLLNAGSG
ncbi:hypothetical protein BD779DRAFT_1785931, partial [Infundibulicybe gibba]